MKIEGSGWHPDPDSDTDQNPDPSVRGMDPRIRIHNKMSWIRNTGNQTVVYIIRDGSVLIIQILSVRASLHCWQIDLFCFFSKQKKTLYN